ncbi:MAG: histidine kinase [Eubacterium sp.]|nr:histidine kinase [Eubacterium sp.]
MDRIFEQYSDYYTLTNIIFVLVSMILTIVVLLVSIQMKNHSRRMGWFIAAVCVNMGGLAFQLQSMSSEQYTGSKYVIASWVMYAFVAPLFGLYFIETERSEGQEWDGYFWTIFQCLIAVLVIGFSVYGGSRFLANIFFLIQYIVVMVMLMISSKSIKASLGFITGLIAPISTSLVGIGDSRFELAGFGLILFLLTVFFGYQMDTEKDLLTSQVELSENKVSLLMEQIHPHFIYNSLQQIALLCDEDPGSVKNAIFSFSGYLRKNFESLTNDGMIPFEQEMEHVDTYIELAEILPSRNFHVHKDFEVTDFYLPALTVQPLVENAIYYGIGMSTEGDDIRISTRREGGFIIIAVSDDGHGKQTKLATQKKHKSVGTKNVKTRLSIMCKGELSINKSPEGTDSIIKIPEMMAVQPNKQK